MAAATITKFEQGYDEMVVVLRTVEGLNAVPSDPVENINRWPIGILYPVDGRCSGTTPLGSLTTWDNIVLGVLVPRKRLPEMHRLLMPFRTLVPKAIYSGLRDNKLTKWENIGEISHTFGPLDWGGVAMVGWLFVLNESKQQQTL